MLRSFRVENHKSIKEEQELSLLPAYDRSRPVVPVAAIFGANAAGKSNLLDALRWLQDAVLSSYGSWLSGSGVPRTPFRLDPATVDAPSRYAVEIAVGGERYSYGVEVDDERVRAEWLHTYPHSRRRVILERDGGTVRLGSTLPEHRARGEALQRQTRDNALLLAVAAQNAVAEVQPVFQWFRQAVRFGAPGAVDVAAVAARLERDAALVRLVQAAGLGIDDIQVEGESVTFGHGKGRLGLADQSAGTRTWLGLGSRALEALEGGGLLAVDAGGAGLHPHLSARLVRLFRDRETNPGGAQLVLATHDATLLDDETLARDEVWFVDKDAGGGATRLFPLAGFHPRKGEDTQGRYLAGTYGAVPLLCGPAGLNGRAGRGHVRGQV